MKKLFTILLLFPLFICFGEISGNNYSYHDIVSKGDAWKTYKKGKFSVQYPSDARLDVSGMMGTSFFIYFAAIDTEKFAPNINLIVRDLKGVSITLDDIGPATEQQIKSIITNPVVIESKKIDTNSGDYWEMIYTGDLGTMHLKWKQHCCIVKGKLYILTLSVSQILYDSFIALGDKVLDSFKVKK